MTLKSLSLIGLISLGSMLAACQNTAHYINAAPQKITGLKMPESVLQAPDGRIFVSEINGFGKDGDGQITLIDTQGKASIYADGLDDPKGLAMLGKDLYVADKTKIVKITPDGKSSVFVAASAFPIAPLFLNDMEADPQGNLYVSDSGDIFGSGRGGAIYKISPAGKVTLLINDIADSRIKAPNGLLSDKTGNVLTELDFASGILYTFNQSNKTLTPIAEGFGGGDGVARRADGMIYVSDWKGGKVFSVDTQGKVTLIKSGYQSAADIALTRDGKYVMVPDMKAGELDFIPLP